MKVVVKIDNFNDNNFYIKVFDFNFHHDVVFHNVVDDHYFSDFIINDNNLVVF